MAPDEFNRWWTDAKLCFPSLQAWLAKAIPDTNQQAAFLRKWRDVLSDVRLDHALEVNRLMQSGDLPLVGEYDGDKEKLPQHVRRLARQIAWDRREKPAEEFSGRLNPTSFPAGKILKRILELTDRGTPADEAKAIVLAELPVGSPRYTPRYHCTVCLDVGMVTVASQRAAEYMLADKFHECHHRESAIVCSCKGHLPQNPKRPHLVYDASADFKLEDFWSKSEVERFREWIEAKRDEYWNSKRESAFDTFNQREFA